MTKTSHILLIGASLAALAIVTPALAQDASMAAAPDSTASSPPAQDDTPGRAIPGRQRSYDQANPSQNNAGAVNAPPPEAFPADQIPVPDRWRILDGLGGGGTQWFDPYNQNTIKGDKPVLGDDWFLDLTGISDSVAEERSFPVGVGTQTTQRSGSLDTFGDAESSLYTQTFIAGADLYEGSTAFKPPEIEFRLSLAYNVNYAIVSERGILSVRPSAPTHRLDSFLGVQEGFVDYHIRNVDDRYDFDSIRVGIQPFSSDFRGFLFQDNQLGIRLFGDRDNNRIQYNLGFFDLLEKDTNSGLNDVTAPLRKDYMAVANVFMQDMPIPGFTSELVGLYNFDREGGDVHYDKNGFPVRPALIGDDQGRNYDVAYLGYSGDGHIGVVNLTMTGYGAFGTDHNNVFTGQSANIRSFFLAAEPSYDLDWARVRLSALYASGNGNPYGKTETGFDSVFENPQFAGSDTSYWIRQAVPFVGGGTQIFLNGRNGILADLRTSKDEGESNFNNPGTILLGTGADFDVLPQLRVSSNINHFWFDNTAVLRTLRQQGIVSTDIGWDISGAITYRPFMTQNIVLRASGAVLVPGGGFNNLFTNSLGAGQYYSVLLNAILTF
jgi:hypothetical protein